MPNTNITPTWMGREVGRIASNETKFVGAITKRLSDDFKVQGVKVGATVGVRLPWRPVTTKGSALQLQALVDTVVYVTITDQAHIDYGWTSREETLEIQDARERYVNPAAYQLANTLDSDGLQRVYQDVFLAEGTPGTVPNVNSTYLNAAARLTNMAAPSKPRRMFINAIMRATIANSNLTLFNPPREISELWKDAMFSGSALSWDEWFESVNIGTHTVGAYGGTPLVNNASQVGSSLVTDGWTATTGQLKRGDRFTVASVNAVNPQNYRSTTQLMTFQVTSTVTADGSGNMTIPIYPPIVTSGGYQTVDSSPANNAVITVLGAAGTVSPQGLGFLPEAFTMASADLIMPRSGQSSRVRMPGVGMSLRFWEDSDISSDSHPSRLDMVYGFKTIRPEFAIAIQS
jgi:coat protein Gp5